jgi:hypothetical protein
MTLPSDSIYSLQPTLRRPRTSRPLIMNSFFQHSLQEMSGSFEAKRYFIRATLKESTISMELRHLRYVVAVAESLSFREASRKLHVSQPSLSVQVKQLEDEVGVRLFHRSKRHVKIALGGEVFLITAREVLSMSTAVRPQPVRRSKAKLERSGLDLFRLQASRFFPGFSKRSKSSCRLWKWN